MASGVIFAELYMVAGERQDASDLVGIATSPMLSLFRRRRGQLFSVTDPSRPGAEAICRRLIEVVEDEYFRVPSRSITRSLEAAINAANDALRAENAQLPPEMQLRVGICCATVRDGDVFVAQVSPATAFILHNGSVTRVFGPPSLGGENGEGNAYASDALGSRHDPHVNFGFSPIQEGDLVLLASGANWKIIPDKYLLDSARQIDPEMAAQSLYSSFTAHVRRPTTSMVVIKVSDLPTRFKASDSERKVRPMREPVVVDRVRKADWRGAPGAAVMEASELDAGVSGRGRTRPATSSRSSRDRADTEPRPTVRAGGSSSRPPASGRAQVRRPKPSAGSSIIEKLRGILPKREKATRVAGQRVASKASVKLRKPPTMRGERRSKSSPLTQLILMIALAAAFVFVGNAAIGLWKSWSIGDPQQLLKQAADKQTLAAAADTPATARANLQQAAELINRALQGKDDQSTRAMAASIQANIDKMDAVVRIEKPSTVVDLSAVVQDKGNVIQMAIDGQNLYLLDDGQDRLFKYALTPDGKGVQETGKHPVLLKKGDRVDGKPAGDLLQMTWMPAGQLRTQPGLFVLDSSRSLVMYDDKLGLSRVDVSDTGKWGAIQSIGAFAGGLYLLDTKQKNVYYYSPTKNGYDAPPYVIMDANGRVDLSKVQDIALDGNLYTLEEGGTVRRFSREGRPLDFVGDVPDGKIAGGKALFASASTRSLYVLDSTGERILQFSPEGKFQRQLKADGKDLSFKDARDLFVDEAARRAYVLTKNSLVEFDLPPMQ